METKLEKIVRFTVGELLPWKGWWFRVDQIFTLTSGELDSMVLKPSKSLKMPKETKEAIDQNASPKTDPGNDLQGDSRRNSEDSKASS